jgi:hypothetical protein
MNKTFRVTFNSPQSGWMSLSLKAGEQSFVAAVSHAPDDSLRALMEALLALLDAGAQRITVKWNCEPDELDFEIRTKDERVEFKVLHFPDHRRLAGTSHVVFSLAVSKLEFCLAFWRALRALHRDIETDEFDKNWRRPFPHSEMRQLTEAFRAFKRQAKAPTLRPRSNRRDQL